MATARRRGWVARTAGLVLVTTALGTAATGAIAADEPVSLSMWVTADGWQKPSVERIAEEYIASHPNVTITVEEFPFLDLHDKLTVALQAGSGAPDVAYVEISRFGSLLKGGGRARGPDRSHGQQRR